MAKSCCSVPWFEDVNGGSAASHLARTAFSGQHHSAHGLWAAPAQAHL